MKDNKIKDRGCVKNFRQMASISVLVFGVVLGAGCSRNPPPSAEQLALGKPVTKQLKNDEIHSYTVSLDKGEFIGLSIEQRDVDVITKVFAPNGELLGEFDTPTSGRGTEQVRVGAESEGEYRFDIYTLSTGAEPGQYTLRQTESRPITERDRKILSAIKLHQEADGLRAKPESRRDSLHVYERALGVWREVGDEREEANTLRAMGFAYQRLDEPENAKVHFGRALEIWETTGDWRSAAFTHIIFGVINKKQNDYEAGLEEDLKALPLWEKAGDMPEYTQNLVRIGNDYVKLQKKSEAVSYFERAVEAGSKVESVALKAYVLSQYGDAQAAFGNKTEALNHYQKSLALWESLKQDKTISSLKEKIAKLQ
ncbi:MAG: tetratricopeptide repeat protein [Acidobacteria bacterium]|nr:tetratricopeptide repeat protein [Acidobacteriota bacterium]